MTLHTQSSQTYGKVLDKMGHVSLAIKAYLQGKTAIESVFGTEHPLFKDLVGLMS